MKHHALLLVTLLIGSSAFANPIDPNRAKTIAIGFMNERAKPSIERRNASLTQVAPDDYVLVSQDVATLSDTHPYYAFNRMAGGYVVVSGDDRLPPVLGYADSGKFSAEKMPPALRQLLDNLANAGSLSAIQPMRTPGEDTRMEIMPLVETQWNQDAPYNNLCPIDPYYNQKSLTGCVPVALAQLMYYHRWPKSGTGTTSYQFGGHTYSADFSAVEYQWDKMQPRYGEGAQEESEDAVATLLYHCAVLARTEFYFKGSYGWYDTDMLANHFGYAPVISWMDLDDYNSDEFDETLYRDLARGLPVVYHSNDLNGPVSHVWLVDGYRKGGYFHCNWGWGGTDDGFYLLSALRPASTSYNFKGGHAIMYNIYPQEERLWYMVADDNRYTEMSKVGALVSADDETAFDVLDHDGRVLMDNVEEIAFSQDLDALITSVPELMITDASKDKFAKLVSGVLILQGVSLPVRIYTTDGYMLISQEPSNGQAVVDIRALKAGNYVARSGRMAFKFIKR